MDPNVKLKNLAWYVKRSWPIFPCGADKKPLTKNGFYDATLDFEQIKKWNERWPDANWGMPTGSRDDGGAGIVVIDLDCHPGAPNGLETWEQLREEHSEPLETVRVRTGGGGSQLYFKYPDGHIVKNKTNVWPGIDVRASGGYVLVPPSETDQRYTFEFSPAETEIQDLPEWILARVNGHKQEVAGTPKEKVVIEQTTTQEPDLAVANSALNALKPERADNYQSWLEVGMSLFALGEDGLIAWDNWSQKSPKYERGACAQKWKTFSDELTTTSKITFGSLIHWAEQDGCAPFIKLCPRDYKPSHFKKALTALGYEFTLNEMNDEVFFNGTRMSDLHWSNIMNSLREYNYKAENYAIDVANGQALENQFHPIREYLNSLNWMCTQENGQLKGFDFVGQLASYIHDKDDVFALLLRKWLIGAVGRIIGDRPGEQNPMLVLDGPQGIGKSRLVWWLGTPLPAFYLQSAIVTDDKDFLIRLCSTWVWEVEELGATFRKSDLESLKSFLSREVVRVRVPYGKRDIVKPATASFIGTINNSGGFLADPTGNRRFRVCSLTSIDWGYEKFVDVNQVWAQAVELYRAGERSTLEPADQARVNEVNAEYEIDDPLAFSIFKNFNVNPAEKDRYTPSAAIIKTLRTSGDLVGGTDNSAAQHISAILAKLGCDLVRVRENGQQVRAWRGVWSR